MDRLEAFLRQELGTHPHDLARHAARELSIQVGEAESAIQRLVGQGVFEVLGTGPAVELAWKPVLRTSIRAGLEENRVFRECVAPHLTDVPDNVRAILHYGTTEMVNNALEHAGAAHLVIQVRRLRDEVEILVHDDGIGIFAKLQRDLHLEDALHVALELSKGKLTTAPRAHTGEGIFFTSRMCDKFLLGSETTVCGQVNHGPWHVITEEHRPGTTVRMVVRLDSTVTPAAVFDEFAPPGSEHSFTKTALQVSLVRHDGEGLFSRSQAKRLLSRCERFREIELDFEGIASLGPAFADEVFRVFPSKHPGVVVRESKTTAEVARMIQRARAARVGPDRAEGASES